LAAVAAARGSENGVDRENAVSTTLIDTSKVQLKLHSYNENRYGVEEFHGDLEVSGGPWNQNIVFGFCFSPLASSQTDYWDCQYVDTTVNASKTISDPIYATTFSVKDYFLKGSKFDPIDDYRIDSSASLRSSTNFVAIDAKSSKKCSKVTELSAGIEIVNCSEVNSHFYRPFKTDSTTEDVRFSSDEDVGKKYQIFGFFADDKVPITPNSGYRKTIGTTLKDWVGVFEAHKSIVDSNASDDSLSSIDAT